jgi:DNA polymerase III delta prime subunit
MLLAMYLKGAPGHRLFRHDERRDVNLCYWISEIEYKPKERDQDKAHIKMSLVYLERGEYGHGTVRFYDDDCVGLTAVEALGRKNYQIENDDLRKKYLEEKIIFDTEHKNIGKQFLAVGVGDCSDIDGNKVDDDDSIPRNIRLDRDGLSAHVVIDVFSESEEDDRSKGRNYKKTYWSKFRRDRKSEFKASDEDELIDEMEEEEAIKTGFQFEEIPIHPFLVCFDLRRHLRMAIHVSNLAEYIYDKNMGKKMVIPDAHRQFIDSLLSHKNSFRDIVKGKGIGAPVLCAGTPGLGKTLVAEVFSETSERPLYNVQCSQLGIDPKSLERSLLRVFARAQRWNAILLFDEADVYVALRGTDLIQNAIVGVFLRTLEYFTGVVFFATNRGDLVDDAILSRCIAKIEFKIPSVEDQRKIWKILTENTGVKLSDSEIDKILHRNPDLSGRDIKNMIKLAMIVSAAEDKLITAETIDLVKKFKPTGRDLEEIL